MANIYQIMYLCTSVYTSLISAFILFLLYRGQIYQRPITDFHIDNTTDCNFVMELFFSKNDTNPWSFRNGADPWPLAMHLGMSNYGCTIPASNFNVTKREVIDIWRLPENTRLSPTMFEIGRCRLAAKEMAMNGIEFDTNECNCLQSWPNRLADAAFFGIVFNVYGFVFGFPVETTKYGSVRNQGKLVLITLIPYLIWQHADGLIYDYFYGNLDIGLWYTIPGHMYPINYYCKSINMFFIRSLIKINYYCCFAFVFLAALLTGMALGSKFAEWYLGKQLIKLINKKKSNDHNIDIKKSSGQKIAEKLEIV